MSNNWMNDFDAIIKSIQAGQELEEETALRDTSPEVKEAWEKYQTIKNLAGSQPDIKPEDDGLGKRLTTIIHSAKLRRDNAMIKDAWDAYERAVIAAKEGDK